MLNKNYKPVNVCYFFLQQWQAAAASIQFVFSCGGDRLAASKNGPNTGFS
jgi:hypothetical protein